MSTQNQVFFLRSCSVIFWLLGLWWGVGMSITLVHGFRERESYHQREFHDALPMLSLLTVVSVGFLIAGWFFWRASRRDAAPKA
jgi:hypothetical protein